MATLQGKAVKNTYRQVLQIGANNVGVSGTLQPVQDGTGTNTALSLSTAAATINGTLTITGDLIITGGGIQIQDLIDDTVATLIQNGTGITWTYNDGARTLTGNFTGTTSVVAEGSNLYFTNARSRTAISETIPGIDYNNTTGVFSLTSGYVIPTTAAFDGKVPYTGATADVNLGEFDLKTSKLWLYDAPNDGYGSIHLADGSMHFEDADGHTMFDIEDGFIQIHKDAAIQSNLFVSNLTATRDHYLPNASGTIALTSNINYPVTSVFGRTGAITADAGDYTTTKVTEGTNLYYTQGRFDSAFAAKSTTNLAEGSNLYYTQARFDTAFSNKSTTNLAEGTNLYYTQARFNSALAAKTTTDLAEGTNLYYTDARARLALASSATGLTYANNSGIFSLTAGYAIPTTVKLGEYDIAYNRSLTSAAVTGTSTKTLTLNQQSGSTITASWTDQGITTINGTANQIATSTVGNTTTIGFTNDVTMPNNLVVSGNLTINGTATYVNTQSISAKDPLFEVANDNNTTDAVDIGYYGRYYDTPQTRIEFTGLFRDASDAGKFKFFTGLVDEPTNVVNTTGTGYTVGTLVANFEGNLAGTANAANALTTARTIAASGDAVWSVSFDGSANVTSALTLANTGVTATTYGTSTSVPTIAIDSKGRITSASNTNIAFPVTTVNGASGTVVLTTSNIAEGSNQYFTTGRAQSAISLTTSGTSGAATYTSGNINVPIYIGGSGTANQIAYFDTTGTISSLATATYPSLTELSYVKGVTSGIQAQIATKANDNAVVHLAGTETITGAKTFSSALTVNVNGSTFGSASASGYPITIQTNLPEQSLKIIGKNDNNNVQFFASDGTTYQAVLGTIGSSFYIGTGTGGTSRLTITSAGAATFSSSIAATSATFSSTVTAQGTLSLTTGDITVGGKIYGFNDTAVATYAGGLKFQTRYFDGSAYVYVDRLTISANGNSTFTNTLTVNNNINLTRPGSGATVLSLQGSAAYGDTSTINFCDGRSYIRSVIITGTANGDTDLTFGTQNAGSTAERLKIGSGGDFLSKGSYHSFYTNSGNTISFDMNSTRVRAYQQLFSDGLITGSNGLSISTTTANTTIGGINTHNTNGDYGYYSEMGGNTNNTSSFHFVGAIAGVGNKIQICGNGNLQNSNNSYGGISDIKVKENITDATDKLQKLLKVRIVNYNLIGDEQKQLGVIAQELEEIFPSMIDEVEDFEDVEVTNEEGNITKEKQSLGTVTKSVKYSVFVPMLIKAIQELEARVKELEAK